jgi:TPR repeat protein
MYSTGNIVPKDDTEAFRLTKLAAEGGYVCGYQLLAEMYEGGKGTDADKEQAKYWAGKCQTTESDQVDGSIKKVKRLFGRKD